MPDLIRPRLVLLPALAATLWLSGCSSGANAKFEESVDFQSVPGNAIVKVDGAPIGQTPTSAVLAKASSTRITILKAGFVSAELSVRPRDGALAPNPVNVTLQPELIPETRGADPQAELTRSLDVLKQYVAMGRIAAEDQTYIETQLRAFYLGPPPPAK